MIIYIIPVIEIVQNYASFGIQLNFQMSCIHLRNVILISSKKQDLLEPQRSQGASFGSPLSIVCRWIFLYRRHEVATIFFRLTKAARGGGSRKKRLKNSFFFHHHVNSKLTPFKILKISFIKRERLLLFCFVALKFWPVDCLLDRYIPIFEVQNRLATYTQK